MTPKHHMPFFGNDFFQAVEGRTDAVVAGYLRSLWHYWHHAHCEGLDDDDDFLRRLCHCEKQDWGRTKPIIFDNDKLFKLLNGKWHQERSQKEWAYAEDLCERREKQTEAARKARQSVTGNVTDIVTEVVTGLSPTPTPTPPLTIPPTPSILNRGFQGKGVPKSFRALQIANRIYGNQDGWAYDNGKVDPKAIHPKALASVIEPHIERGEKFILMAWQEAATEAHMAVVDKLCKQDPVAYAVACFKARLEV